MSSQHLSPYKIFCNIIDCFYIVCFPGGSEVKCLFRSSAHFLVRSFGGFLLLFWIVWVACIFWKLSSLSVASFVNIFSQSVGFYFSGFLCCATAYKFDRSHLFIFAFICIDLGDRQIRYFLKASVDFSVIQNWETPTEDSKASCSMTIQ